MRAWVTGGSSGIGWATAALLRDAGHEVVCLSRRAEGPPGCRALPLDLRAEDLADRLRFVMGEAGLPDWVVLSAGMGAFVGAWNVSREHALEMATVNLVAPLVLASWIVREARAAHRGARVVFVTSTAPRAGGSAMGVYAAMKAGVEAWVRCEAPHQARRGVELVVAAPGWVESPMTAAMKPEKRRAAERRCPEGRFATIDETARFICDVLRDRESYPAGGVYEFWSPVPAGVAIGRGERDEEALGVAV